MNIDREQFERIVEEAIGSLEDKFRKKLHNVAIFVEEWPSEVQLKKVGLKNKMTLFGLFEGYAQAKRLNFGPVLPDRITIFRQPIIRAYRAPEAIRKQIISTAKHEIAHHFGSDERGAGQASQA